MASLRQNYDINITKLIGNNIRIQRKMQGLSSIALANKMGVSTQQIQKYETGANRISAEFLYQIALALNVQVSIFYTSSDSETNTETTPVETIDYKTMSLMTAYNKITNPKIREKVIAIVKTMVKEKEA